MDYSFVADVERLVAITEAHLSGGFTFVSAGASDGVTSDPVYPLFERWGGSGVAVEPVPFLFDRLQRNYAHLTEVTCLPMALAAESGRSEIWYIDAGHGGLEYITQAVGNRREEPLHRTIDLLREVAHQIPTDLPIHPDHAPVVRPEVGSGIPHGIEDHIRSSAVDAVTFDDLVERGELDHVDLVNLHIGDEDYEVFSAIDWKRWRPKVLILHMYGMSEQEDADVLQTLTELGYRRNGSFTLFSGVFLQEASASAMA